MSKDQTRRSISTDAVTFWRADQLARKLGESVSGTLGKAINELADAHGIPIPGREEARDWVLSRRRPGGAYRKR